MELIFASGNEHKVVEVGEILKPHGITILSLKDIGYLEDIPETGSTMSENALIKARTIYNNTGKNVFADDSGLEVQALNMEPGLYTARYAGPQKNALDNMTKLLANMDGIADRTARFRAVMALIINGEEQTFEGIVNGRIHTEMYGEGGFGYDPVFIPEGYDQTFAELSDDIKNKMSHRFNALDKMIKYLDNLKS